MTPTPLDSHRPRWRAYLLLSRLSNLPTVWTNVLAAVVVAGVVPEGRTVAALAAAASLLYTAGMFLNDAFDAVSDARHRPDRPVPAGDVARGEVFAIGFGLLAAGAAAMLAWRPSLLVIAWTLALAGAIVYYDYRHKASPLGPAVMGACRGLLYGLVAAAAAGATTAAVLVAAGVVTIYVVLLSAVAKRIGPRASVIVPILIAGISIVDATIIAAAGRMDLAGIAALASLLTLALQRLVPGT